MSVLTGEMWLALAAGLLSFAAIAVVAIIRLPQRKNNNSPSRRNNDQGIVSDGDCEDRRKSVKAILHGEVEVLDVKLGNVVQDVVEMKIDIREIKTGQEKVSSQTTQILAKLS